MKFKIAKPNWRKKFLNQSGNQNLSHVKRNKACLFSLRLPLTNKTGHQHTFTRGTLGSRNDEGMLLKAREILKTTEGQFYLSYF